MIDESVASLARLMQDAAVDPLQWEAALNAINAFTQSFGAVLLSVGARRKYAPTSTDIAEMIDDYFGGGWYAHDRREACIPLLKQEGIVCDRQFQTDEDIENCDFYWDFLAKHGRKWFAGVGVEVEGDHWCLALQRGPKSEPFGKDDMARLRVVRDLLASTAHLSRRTGQHWVDGLRNALDVTGQPAILFDGQGRVAELNDAAAHIVGSFIRPDGSIYLGSTEASAALVALLQDATRPPTASPRTKSKTVIRVGRLHYGCRAISLLENKGLLACRAAVLLLMEPVVESVESVLRRTYGLTNAELKVATALADGKSVQEVAVSEGHKADSIRSHLKSIYRKVEVNKQAQLVALMKKLDARR